MRIAKQDLFTELQLRVPRKQIERTHCKTMTRTGIAAVHSFHAQAVQPIQCQTTLRDATGLTLNPLTTLRAVHGRRTKPAYAEDVEDDAEPEYYSHSNYQAYYEPCPATTDGLHTRYGIEITPILGEWETRSGRLQIDTSRCGHHLDPIRAQNFPSRDELIETLIVLVISHMEEI